MKQVKNSLNTLDLTRMLKAAEKEKISPALTLRMLKIYMGADTNLMLSEQGLYLQSMFNQIAVAVGHRNPSELILAIMRSSWFVLGKVPEGMKSSYPILWFASPLFFDEKELVQQLRKGGVPEEPLQNDSLISHFGDLFTTQLFDSTFGVIISIINYTGSKNIILSGRKMVPSSGALVSAVQKKERLLPEKERIQQVEIFLYEVQRSEAYRGFFDSLKRQLTDPTENGLPKKNAERYSWDEAHEILHRLMFNQVKKYFTYQERFFRTTSFTNRMGWLTRLLLSGSGKRMLADAIKDFKAASARRKHKEQQEAVKNQRSHRPISEHEWMQDGLRYYQDSDEGLVQLPADAPPRPSDKAHWNKFTQKWF